MYEFVVSSSVPRTKFQRKAKNFHRKHEKKHHIIMSVV